MNKFWIGGPARRRAWVLCVRVTPSKRVLLEFWTWKHNTDNSKTVVDVLSFMWWCVINYSENEKKFWQNNGPTKFVNGSLYENVLESKKRYCLVVSRLLPGENLLTKKSIGSWKTPPVLNSNFRRVIKLFFNWSVNICEPHSQKKNWSAFQ